MSPLLRLHVLASGSQGNAYLVEGPEGLVLVDDGLSRRELLRRSAELGVDAEAAACCIVTHEHTDHTKGLPVWVKHWSGRLLGSWGTAHARPSMESLPFEPVELGASFSAGGMTVRTFPTSHDVREPLGLVFSCGDDAVGICTDTGVVTDAAMEALRGVRVLALESNHDTTMLKNGPHPRYLQERVGGRYGHLSNAQAAEALPRLVTERTETVVAMHISQKNNRPSLAVAALAGALGATAPAACCDFTAGRVRVVAAGQDRPMTV